MPGRFTAHGLRGRRADPSGKPWRSETARGNAGDGLVFSMVTLNDESVKGNSQLPIPNSQCGSRLGSWELEVRVPRSSLAGQTAPDEGYRGQRSCRRCR
jgi:hypothetical protein